MLHAICALGLSTAKAEVVDDEGLEEEEQGADNEVLPGGAKEASALSSMSTTATSRSVHVVSATRKEGATDFPWSSSKGGRDSGDSKSSASRDSRLAGSPHSALAQDFHQATPERLARVQQQVREHLLEAKRDSAEDGTRDAQPQKLSVRDLLGHFEPQGVAGRDRGTLGGTLGGIAGGQNGQRSSYGFGNSSTAKNVLRKAVSHPTPATTTDSGSTNKSNNKNVVWTSLSCSSSNNNSSKNVGRTSFSVDRGSSNNNNNTNGAQATTTTSFVSNGSGKYNGSNINNKLASSSQNASRKSFLDSIIALGAGVAGDGQQGARRASGTSMEEVNNLLNAAQIAGEKDKLDVRLSSNRGNEDAVSNSRRDSVSDSRRDSVSDSRRDSVSDSRRDSVSDSRRDSVSDSRRDSISDSRRDSISDSRRDSVKDSRRDSGKDSRRDSVSDSRRDSISDPRRDSVKDSRRDSGKEARRDSGKEARRDSVSDSRRDSGKDSRRDSVSDSRRDSGKEARRDPAKESRRASLKDARQDSVDDGVQDSQDIPSIVDQLPEEEPIKESRRTTSQWDPAALVAVLYAIPEPLRDKPRPVNRVNVEGFLDRLPSGRTKATFWNAWKRCYFRAKDGFLYCYPTKHSDKPMDVTQLMGGQVETFESMVITAQDRNPATVPMIGIDDRMGHYLVVRAGTQEETDRWLLALRTHTVEDSSATYVQPWPVPRVPALLRDTVVVDLGSRSVRAGILCSQPSLPQLFFPAVCASRRGSPGEKVYGPAALHPGVRANSTLSYPIRSTERINKHTVELGAVSGLLRVVFQSLAVDPRDYGVVVSVPRTLDAATQSRLVAELFDVFGVRSVLLSHQTVLALYAYNAASGVVVDVGERTDVVPIMDGYIVEGGVSRVPYGGEEMLGHVRRLLLQRAARPLPVSLGTVAEGLLPRYALERLCFVSPSYRTDLRRGQRDPTELTASVSVSEFFAGDREPTMETLTLDVGRFQAPEGLFHPQAWGLDNPGVPRMVHKAIQECSMDARKTMARSVFLAGGLTMLPGFADRLRDELAALLPAAAQPKVHASPYRCHAAYLGACVLANSSGVHEMCLTKEEYTRDGSKLIRPWIL